MFKENYLMLLPKFKIRLLVAILFLTCAAISSHAQNSFNSGSTGADGALNVPASTTVTLQVPESGVFNFTTVTINAGATLKFTRNSKNTPIVILASGDVAISNGNINIDGASATTTTGGVGALGGPGGYAGGKGGTVNSLNAQAGDGPGGGGAGLGSTAGAGGGGGGSYATVGSDGGGVGPGQAGNRYGSPLLLPLVGGSGGGGSGSNGTSGGTGGGGGGGAILIASSGAIRFLTSGNVISALGGASSGSAGQHGGGGSGGAIRLIANLVTGIITFNVTGGLSTTSGAGGRGYARIEAFDFTGLALSSGSSPVDVGPPNPIFLPANAPQLTIASVAGIAAPSSPNGSFRAPADIVVPTTTSNPVNVVLNASNISTGTLIQVSVIPEAGSRTAVTSSPLSGTTESSTTTASITLPQGLSVITATTTVEVLQASATPIFIEGERVERIEVTATYGSDSELTYITKSGRRVKLSELK
jgi:hypothetical protein